jgi:hypothetical protein
MRIPRATLLLSLVLAVGCARHRGGLAGLGTFEVPRFETRIEVSTGTSLHADYVVGDLDGDGLLDMAVISVTGELKILIGNGTTFAAGQELQIGGLPIWMAAADFDNDGDLDLVVVRSNANSTGLWLNDGSGTFSPGGSLEIGAFALAVAVGDLDGDGNADVVVSKPEAPEILIGFGDGLGGFDSTLPLSLPGGGQAFHVAIGDATRDSYLDLVVSDPSLSRVVIFPGGGGKGQLSAGAFSFELYVPGSPAAVSFGDLNGDLLDDLVVTAFASDRFVVITEILQPEGYGNSYGYVSFDIIVPATPLLSTVADVTGDGLPDLVACLGGNATMCVAPRDPNGGIGDLLLFDATGLPLRPFVGDFDGNGKNDMFALAGGGNRVNLWLAKADGALAGARSYQTGLPLASWIEGGDFDGDGDAELVTGSFTDSRLNILGGAAGGVLAVEATIDVGLPIYQLEAGDLDGDGLPDIVVGVPGGIRLLRNVSTPGSYAFVLIPGSPATIGSGNFPFGIALADLDRDGDVDIALCDYDGGGVHVILGTDVPFEYGAETIVPVGSGPVDLVAADFNGDGLRDLAVSRAIAGDILVLRNDDGAFAPWRSVPVGSLPNYLVTADFNRDGRADLVVSNAGSNTVTVLFGTGAGFTSQDFPAGDAPTALLARDLTRDGIPDILVASLIGGDFRVLVGDGNGGFPLLPTFPGTAGASDAVLQDMTGDGRPELMITSLITNRVSLVKNVSQPAAQ